MVKVRYSKVEAGFENIDFIDKEICKPYIVIR